VIDIGGRHRISWDYEELRRAWPEPSDHGKASKSARPV